MKSLFAQYIRNELSVDQLYVLLDQIKVNGVDEFEDLLEFEWQSDAHTELSNIDKLNILNNIQEKVNIVMSNKLVRNI
jgi:hypothetical protein